MAEQNEDESKKRLDELLRAVEADRARIDELRANPTGRAFTIAVERVKEPATVHGYIQELLEKSAGITILIEHAHMPSFTYHVDPGVQNPFADDQVHEQYEGMYKVKEHK